MKLVSPARLTEIHFSDTREWHVVKKDFVAGASSLQAVIPSSTCGLIETALPSATFFPIKFPKTCPGIVQRRRNLSRHSRRQRRIFTRQSFKPPHPRDSPLQGRSLLSPHAGRSPSS